MANYQATGRPPIGVRTVLINQLINRYKNQAIARGLSFDLTRKEFVRLASGNCYYCGVEPIGRFRYKKGIPALKSNGIDRIDNNVGYVIGNCVSCCMHCNRAKMIMTVFDFLKLVERIYNHRIKKSGVI